MRCMLTIAIMGGTVMSAQAETFVCVWMAPEQSIQIFRMTLTTDASAPWMRCPSTERRAA